MKPLLILGPILVLGLVLRLYNLNLLPTFISDEASIGYNAYSILKTGKDEWGVSFPLVFKAFGENKLPVYIYSVVPFVGLFDLKILAVRLPSALAGTLTLVGFYLLLGLVLPRSNTTSLRLLGALCFALLPWPMQVSRLALEANLALCLVVFAAYFLLKAKTNLRYYYPALGLFALSLYTYNTCRVFVPLFLFSYFATSRHKFTTSVKFLVGFLVLCLPIFLSGFSGSTQRFSQVSIFNNPGLINKINSQRGTCLSHVPGVICRLRYNKPVEYSLQFSANYLSHFGPTFLFTQGSNLANYQLPHTGSLAWWLLPFLLLGVPALTKHPDRKFILAWLVLAPLANSLTGQAHPVRSLVLFPILLVIGLLGLNLAMCQLNRFKPLWSKLLLAFVVCSLGLTSLRFFTSYFSTYAESLAWNWQAGYQPLYQDLIKESPTKSIYLTKYYGEPHIFFLFYNRYDPSKLHRSPTVFRYVRSDGWVNYDRIDAYYFIDNPADLLPVLPAQALLVAAANQVPAINLPDKILYYGQEPVFWLYSK